MRILLPLLLCVRVIARVVPAVSNPVPDSLLVQNAKVQGGTQQPIKPLVRTLTGSSKIYMSDSKDAIQYSYIIQAISGTTITQLNKVVAYADGQQKISFAKETNETVKSYLKLKTKSGYGGSLSVGLGVLLPYFAGYYLDSVVQELAKNPQIKAVAQNVGGIAVFSKIENDTSVPWHLFKMSANPTFLNYDVRYRDKKLNYRYLDYAGLGVAIYIVDFIWGMQSDDLYLRAPRVLSQLRKPTNENQTHLHGVKVAAFAARRDIGVAKKAQIVMVETGTSAFSVLNAIEMAINDYLEHDEDYYFNGAVINLSIGFKKVFHHSIIRETISICLVRFPRITFVVAAGNDGVDACTFDFNLSEEAIRVGALNVKLEIDPEYNYGKCIDVLAPGRNLKFNGKKVSGTSYSTPIVSGLAAYLYSLSPMMHSQYMARNGDMKMMIKRYALEAKLSPGKIDKGTTRLLANNGINYGWTDFTSPF